MKDPLAEMSFLGVSLKAGAAGPDPLHEVILQRVSLIYMFLAYS